jgi:uncharacterized membrane protein YbaN (DUF454 family)
MAVLRVMFVILGSISLGVGILGIVVPGLPATPFFLLTAALYMRSSEKLYHKLVTGTVAGRYIRDFHEKKGMTLKSKIWAVSLMWTMIAISCLFGLESLTAMIIVVATGITGTVVMGFVVPTVGNDQEI